MNDRMNAKLNMAQRTLETLIRHQDEYKTISPMADAVEELKKDIINIQQADKDRDTVILSVATKEKREAEKQMIIPCVKVANILYVIGFTTDNKELMTLNEVSEHNFFALTSNAALTLAKRILDFAKKYSEQLKKYNIDDKKINEVATAIDAFNKTIAKPMDTISERKQKTSNLVQLFAKLDSTIYDKLDKIMILFKESNTDFYNEYRTSRNFIITSTRKKEEKS